MNEPQRTWAEARDRLSAAVADLGFPPELAPLLARELKSPRAMDRMCGYLRQARPRSMEQVADELLAIRSDIDTWKEKKAAQEAQEKYNTRLFYARGGDEEED